MRIILISGELLILRPSTLGSVGTVNCLSPGILAVKSQGQVVIVYNLIAGNCADILGHGFPLFVSPPKSRVYCSSLLLPSAC